MSPQVAPRVLLLIDHLDMGGAERILVETAPRLAVHGLEVRVGILDDRPAGPLAHSLRERGVVVDRLGFRRLLDWAALGRLDRCIRSYRPAVVHAQLEFANIAGLWLGRRYGAKGVTTLHTMIEPCVRLDRASLRHRLERWSIGRHAERVICVSEALSENRRTTWMLPAGRLEVLHNGIDLQRFKPPSAEAAAAARASLGLAADADVLMTVAVLRSPKGLEFMLRALSELAEAHPRLRYVVVGDGDDRPRLERIARALGLTERVMFIGARNNIEQVLPAADVFVLPTLMEALPTVLAEAAGMGLPIVASRVGGVAEMVDDGNSGFLVPPADPGALSQGCGKLLADPDLRRSMGGRARRLAEEWFDLERQIGRLAQLYRRLISETGAGGCV